MTENFQILKKYLQLVVILFYQVKEFEKGPNRPCGATAVLNTNSLDYLYKITVEPRGNKSKEISGKLLLNWTTDNRGYPICEIVVDQKGLNNGKTSDAKFVKSRYNFHTHPYEAYVQHNCELGWPSNDDYYAFINGYLDYDTTLHIIVTLEGLYLLSVAKDAIMPLNDSYKKNKKKLIDNCLEPYIDSIDIDKIGFRKNVGIKFDNYSIHNPQDYVKFINNSPVSDKYLNIRQLFNLQFLSWDNSLNSFDFYYPKIGGNCFISEDNLKKNLKFL